MAARSKRALTLVEIILYGGLLALVVFTAMEGIEFFREWQCRKNMTQINEQLEVYMTEKTHLPDSLDDLAPYLKKDSKGKIPRCSSVPPGFTYQYSPLEKKVRCSYHGLVP